MRKTVLAAILALPFTAIGLQQASAGGCGGCGDSCGCCTPTYRVGFSLGLCWKGWAIGDHCPCDPCRGKVSKCGPCGACGNPFVGGYGPVPPCGPTCGPPAPWYQYYPGGGGGGLGGPSFPTPAPTGYPYGGGGTQSPVGSPLFGANFNNMQAPVQPQMAPAPQVMPCGYYPQAAGQGYWYGR